MALILLITNKIQPEHLCFEATFFEETNMLMNEMNSKLHELHDRKEQC